MCIYTLLIHAYKRYSITTLLLKPKELVLECVRPSHARCPWRSVSGHVGKHTQLSSQPVCGALAGCWIISQCTSGMVWRALVPLGSDFAHCALTCHLPRARGAAWASVGGTPRTACPAFRRGCSDRGGVCPGYRGQALRLRGGSGLVLTSS